MAVYKVPQDVEAEDKLIGPFGFRQFVYLMIAGFCIFLAYLFFRIYPLMASLPLPIIAFFILLALPLRKDQPMEIYLLALLRFYLKPKRRMWNPDGTITYVEITAPKAVEELPTKGLTQDVAEQRLDYLARVMDSRGWSIKGVPSPNANSNVTQTVAAESSGITDIMDDHAAVARSFDDLLAKQNQQNRQNAVARMKQQTPPQPARPRFARNPYDDVLVRQFAADAGVPIPAAQSSNDDSDDTANGQPSAQLINVFHPAVPSETAPASHDDTTSMTAPRFNPYPTSIHQKIISPAGPAAPAGVPPQNESRAQNNNAAQNNAIQSANPPKPQNNAQKPMAQMVSPDIIRLASNTDLSISAIANEAHRLDKPDQDDEVFIKLR